VNLVANATINAGAANAIFSSTIDGAFRLIVNSTAATTFGGAIGATTALAGLTTNAGGTTAINGGAVITTTGDQTYNDARHPGRRRQQHHPDRGEPAVRLGRSAAPPTARIR